MCSLSCCTSEGYESADASWQKGRVRKKRQKRKESVVHKKKQDAIWVFVLFFSSSKQSFLPHVSFSMPVDSITTTITTKTSKSKNSPTTLKECFCFSFHFFPNPKFPKLHFSKCKEMIWLTIALFWVCFAFVLFFFSLRVFLSSFWVSFWGFFFSFFSPTK